MPVRPRIVTLLTDFSLADHYVAAMKGAILGIEPRAIIVDISHTIAPHDIESGAFTLFCAYREFPRGTVHVAVVDPGVGSERPAVAAKTRHYFFVGPHNGLLDYAVADDGLRQMVRLTSQAYVNPSRSTTFHGRDVFAPAAAHLAAGLKLGRLGPEVSQPRLRPFPAARQTAAGLAGQIVHVDPFGNAISNIRAADMAPTLSEATFYLAGRRIKGVTPYYHAGKPGQILAIAGSSGFIEFSLREAALAKKLGVTRGTKVEARLPRHPKRR